MKIYLVFLFNFEILFVCFIIEKPPRRVNDLCAILTAIYEQHFGRTFFWPQKTAKNPEF